MPHPRDVDHWRQQGAYSPASSASYHSEPYYDRHHGRAVQPYRDSRAMQPYYDDRRRPMARRRSESNLNGGKAQSGGKAGWFKDHGGEIAGAVIGGYAGHKKGDDHLKTASGAAVGAIGGKIVERGYKKWSDKREDKKVGHQVRHSRDVSSSDDGYEPRPYGYEREPRYARSVGGRSRGRSASRGRDRSPQTWKDMGRNIMRSLSRKRKEQRDERSDYSDYSR